MLNLVTMAVGYGMNIFFVKKKTMVILLEYWLLYILDAELYVLLFSKGIIYTVDNAVDDIASILAAARLYFHCYEDYYSAPALPDSTSSIE